MSVLVLTGPAGAGKNTIGAYYAFLRERCAVIDVDKVRLMVAKPTMSQWQGVHAEIELQARLAVENTCLLAHQFARAGFDVIILDCVWDYVAPIYKERLAPLHAKYVLLAPTLPEVLRRNQQRGWLQAPEAEWVYRETLKFMDYDLKIDNTALTPGEVAEQLSKWLAA